MATLGHDCQDTPIRELWNVAYEKLREEDVKLIEKYETSLQGSLLADLDCVLSLKTSRREWMDTILKHKMQQIQANIWKLTFRSSEIQLTGAIQKILGVLKLVNEFVTAAVNSNPSASLAWAGVGVLLPVSDNIAWSTLSSYDEINQLFAILAIFEPYRAGFKSSRWTRVHFITHRTKSNARRLISSALWIKQPCWSMFNI